MVRQYFPGKVGEASDGNLPTFLGHPMGETDARVKIIPDSDRACACMQIARNIFRRSLERQSLLWMNFLFFYCFSMSFRGVCQPFSKRGDFCWCVLCHVQEPVLAVILRTGGGDSQIESQKQAVALKSKNLGFKADREPAFLDMSFSCWSMATCDVAWAQNGMRHCPSFLSPQL